MNRLHDGAHAPASIGRLAVMGAIGVGFVVYFITLHALIADHTMPAMALMLAIAPWTIAIVASLAKWIASRAARQRAIIAAGTVVGLMTVAALAWHFGPRLIANADFVLYLESLVFFVWLSSLFAFSLAAGREPLVTRMARSMRRDDMPPEVIRYTRLVTVAWALFFVVVATISTLLFFTQSPASWSLFVYLLMWPLIGAAFVIEYAIRVTVLRNVPHASLLSGMRAFQQRDESDAGDHR
jgi:uncharacterized membrane protein